jgi:hypothetical protein
VPVVHARPLKSSVVSMCSPSRPTRKSKDFTIEAAMSSSGLEETNEAATPTDALLRRMLPGNPLRVDVATLMIATHWWRSGLGRRRRGCAASAFLWLLDDEGGGSHGEIGQEMADRAGSSSFWSLSA